MFANDFDEKKARSYRANWADDILCEDVARLTVTDLPSGADLAWASFPCQDLSLAGNYRGLGQAGTTATTRSGTFWPFWSLMRKLAESGGAPKLIVLENVYGVLTSHAGRDFAAICSALDEEGYRFGAMVIDAVHFLPQSRQRVFFVAVAKGVNVPSSLTTDGPTDEWSPPALIKAHVNVSLKAQRSWVWWKFPMPPICNIRLEDLIEENPKGVEWHSKRETTHILKLMAPLHREKVKKAKQTNNTMVGTIYRRTRPLPDGGRTQRAEVRFDGLAGCLRTPAGGSSRQTILVVKDGSVRSRLLSPREAARLMGLPESYKLPDRYNDAYHLCGDGICVPVVRALADKVLEPILMANREAHLIAAE